MWIILKILNNNLAFEYISDDIGWSTLYVLFFCNPHISYLMAFAFYYFQWQRIVKAIKTITSMFYNENKLSFFLLFLYVKYKHGINILKMTKSRCKGDYAINDLHEIYSLGGDDGTLDRINQCGLPCDNNIYLKRMLTRKLFSEFWIDIEYFYMLK